MSLRSPGHFIPWRTLIFLSIFRTTILRIFIRKAFDIHFDTNESDNKLILLERRFDVIFRSFSSSIKVRYFLIVHMTSS